MAGQPQRGSRGRGRSHRPDSSGPSATLPPAYAGGPGGDSTSGRRSRPTTRQPSPASNAQTRPTDPADGLVTRTTFRLLLTKGFAPDEAANLTAFLCGIPIADVHWSLRQVNQLLFLREMARTGRFGSRDGDPPRPH